MPILWMVGASARYSDLLIPVETGTPPYKKELLREKREWQMG